MLPAYAELADRLRWAREKKGHTQVSLAKRLGVSQGAIEKAENGKSRKPKFMPEAAVELDVPYEWLRDGTISYEQEAGMRRSGGGFADNAPVYGYASGASSKVALNEGAIIDYAPRHNPAMGNDGFYLIVVGDSMEPRYEEGEKIAVSRAMPIRKGKDCVIEFLDGTAAVKRFISRTERELVCEQLNPRQTLKYNMNEIVSIYAVVGHEF